MAVTETTFSIKSFKMLTPTVFELAFETEQPFPFVAGQFMSIVIPGAGPNGKDLRRAYSIASWPEKHPIQLCIKLVEKGPGTSYLYKLKPGEQFKAYAPYGDFVYKFKPGKHAFFIATGTGVAPFRAIMQSKAFQAALPPSTTCLFGVREESELLYMDELANLPFAKFIPMVSRPVGGEKSKWNWTKGRVTDYLRNLSPTDFPWGDMDFYLCGNGAMIDEVKKFLMTERGVLKENFHQEVYYKPKPGE